MSKSDGWGQYVAAHPERGFEAAFPVKEGKALRALNWLYMSHLFRPGHHETPDRVRCRALLLDPPEPPFLLCIALLGQKHVIFKGEVAHNRSVFPVQADDDRIYIKREEFIVFLDAFETLYAMGFSKDSIVDGRDWNQARILKLGISRWRTAEAIFAPLRCATPGYLVLAHHCAQRPAGWIDPISVQASQAHVDTSWSKLITRGTTPDEPQASLF